MRLCATAAAVAAVSCAACDAPGRSPFFEGRSSVVVLDTTPVAGATDVSIDAVLEIELTGDVTQQAVDDAFSLVELPALTPVFVAVTYADGLVRVTPGDGLDLDTQYRASLTGLVDARGRVSDPFEWDFTTLNPPAPALFLSVPAQGTTVPGNFVVRAAFSVPLNAALLGASPIRLNAGAIGGATTYDAPSQTLTFRPNTTVDGAVAVALDPVTDVYGRQFAPAGWTFDAVAATVDALRPTLAGAVTATESSAGTIIVTFDPALDDQWSGTSLRYDARITRLPPPAPAGCLDPFEPETRRGAVYGSAGAITFSGLGGGSWSVVLEAEDGSGRRSLPSMVAGTVPLILDTVTFDAVIQPILGDKCALSGCHVGSAAPGYVDYTGTRDEIASHVSQLDVELVVPYCLEQSYLWRKLTPGYEIEGQLMPPAEAPSSALSRRERELFRRWIQEQGSN